MDTPELIIRRLQGDADAELYREIRLELLRLSPESYGSDHATESAHSSQHFVSRLEESWIFAAFLGDDLVGVAGLAVDRGVKRSHKGFLWGVYVRPKARNLGIARRLAETVLAEARGKVELVQLSVERRNLHARRLYTGLGFVEYGLEVNARRIGDRYFDDVLMAKPVF